MIAEGLCRLEKEKFGQELCELTVLRKALLLQHFGPPMDMYGARVVEFIKNYDI